MRVVVEGERYDLDLLETVFGEAPVYHRKDLHGIITYVGYYNSIYKNEIVYSLPKVFIQNSKVFGVFDPQELLLHDFHVNYKHDSEYKWARQLLYFFYLSLAKFRKKYSSNTIIDSTQSLELTSNLGSREYSYIDLLFSFVNFYKKQKNTIHVRHIENISNRYRRTNWTKTLSKSASFIDETGNPIYDKMINRKPIYNREEDLLIYFLSILNYFNKEHHLKISIDKSFNLIDGTAFERLCKIGSVKLKKNKYKYFSDLDKRMYALCELFFEKFNINASGKRVHEYLLVKNYNIVFEEMIDSLFSDSFDSKPTSNPSLNDLKNNKDGKIIDHLYEYDSLIDARNIFYIGDSKYYKSDKEAGMDSIYKQFTYAKNVIQFNIDLFNEHGHYYRPLLRYRDEITEGYNISPNFFIYGYLPSLTDFNNPLLQTYRGVKRSYHFIDRLFDRDTLFVHFYQINFLFALKAYCMFNTKEIQDFQTTTRKSFKENFISYFNNYELSEFKFYQTVFKNDADMISFVEENFRLLIGKQIAISENTLLVAVHSSDKKTVRLLSEFAVVQLPQ